MLIYIVQQVFCHHVLYQNYSGGKPYSNENSIELL